MTLIAGPISTDTTLQHLTKTITFAGGAGTGAVGTVTVATLSGRVLIPQLTAYCTLTLVSAGAGSVALGHSASASWYIPATVATTVATNKWWHTSVPATGMKEEISGASNARQFTTATDQNVIVTVTVGDVTGGTIVFDIWWQPITAGATLT